MLKSGGHPLCVEEVNDGKAVCVWMGNEGDLFRETLPLVVLESAELDLDDDEEDEDDEDEDEDDEEEEDEDHGKKKKS
ncbi:DUF2158 domain-containing protein [Bradyrhizobium roseum]|uniref:DUF2158 domain-containing protein n=1 Tax=Bradyrhizobium roseum TaxID=3056648 RepID=UPI0026016FB9|nr:DUF2158 domain-containing protein [Bradyrhizobium roseus]WKA30217.1 DUF2158 domain-containing protein [Bradyrhizobium roseus]